MSNAPVPSVLASVAQDLTLLFGKTLRLARTESTQAVRSAAIQVGAVLVGVGAALVGVLVLVSALVGAAVFVTTLVVLQSPELKELRDRVR